MSGPKGGVPDAWDDDWETIADVRPIRAPMGIDLTAC